MRAVLQRVREASVTVDGRVAGQIGHGLLALVGATHDDTTADAEALATKMLGLRIFPDEDGKMNRSVLDVAGAVLVVSQFTLYGDARKGRRPSFTDAAPPDVAQPLVDELVRHIEAAGVVAACGKFGAHMDVGLINDGPVTILLETSGGRFV